jgi:CheY-like chemotaxis protein
MKKRVPAAKDDQSEQDRAARESIRVLVAEDDDDIRDTVRDLLECDGYDVSCVASGGDLLAYLSSWILDEPTARTAPADVIVTDVRMPGFNGLNIVEGLRAKGFRQPIVIMTTFSDDAMRARVSKLGSAALVDKPFDPETFERVVAGLLSQRTQ